MFYIRLYTSGLMRHIFVFFLYYIYIYIYAIRMYVLYMIDDQSYCVLSNIRGSCSYVCYILPLIEHCNCHRQLKLMLVLLTWSWHRALNRRKQSLLRSLGRGQELGGG